MDDAPSADVTLPPLPGVRCVVLIAGHSRSGSTLLGANLDGHPRAVVANDSASSANLR